ncbi:MAG: hypothetical protein R3C03_18140 [Pirellulaceae bacterium]
MATYNKTIPLLRDHHTHPMLYAAFATGVDLSVRGEETNAEALASEAVRRIAQATERNPTGWTIAYGWNDGVFPISESDIDALPPVVVFNVSLHTLRVNRHGRELMNKSFPELVQNLHSPDWIERNLRRVLNAFANDGATASRLVDFYDKILLRQHGIYYAEEMLMTGVMEIDLFADAGLLERTRFWAAGTTGRIAVVASTPGSRYKTIH